MDEDGFVFLDSRIKRLIIRHDGFKVFPSMIENVISRHPAVQQCSVVAAPTRTMCRAACLCVCRAGPRC